VVVVDECGGGRLNCVIPLVNTCHTLTRAILGTLVLSQSDRLGDWCYAAVPLVYSLLCCWRRGVVVSGVRRMNEVNARRARLVPGWVTVVGRVYHLGM